MKALWRRPEALLGLVLVLSAVLTALLAPWIAPYDPLAVDLARKLMSPSAEHWMGTDQTGRASSAGSSGERGPR
jgi:peptide/nickel transport system permease protein